MPGSLLEISMKSLDRLPYCSKIGCRMCSGREEPSHITMAHQPRTPTKWNPATRTWEIPDDGADGAGGADGADGADHGAGVGAVLGAAVNALESEQRESFVALNGLEAELKNWNQWMKELAAEPKKKADEKDEKKDEKKEFDGIPMAF